MTYQVLTKETAFIGMIKQDDKVIGELTKVVVPTSLAEDSSMRKLSYAALMGMMHDPAAGRYKCLSNYKGGRGGI